MPSSAIATPKYKIRNAKQWGMFLEQVSRRTDDQVKGETNEAVFARAMSDNGSPAVSCSPVHLLTASCRPQPKMCAARDDSQE
jgi:hypothetical protein